MSSLEIAEFLLYFLAIIGVMISFVGIIKCCTEENMNFIDFLAYALWIILFINSMIFIVNRNIQTNFQKWNEKLYSSVEKPSK